MENEGVDLMGASSFMARYDQFMVGNALSSRAILAQHGDRLELSCLGGEQRGDHVRRPAARAEDHENITGPAESLNLARVDPVETVVIADAGEQRWLM